MKEQQYKDVMKTRHRPSQAGRRWQVQIGCLCGGSAKGLEGVVTLGRRSDTRQHRRSGRWQVCRFRASPVAEPSTDVAPDELIHPLKKADFFDLTQDSTLNWESTPAE